MIPLIASFFFSVHPAGGWTSLDIGSMAVNCYYKDYYGKKGNTVFLRDAIRLHGSGSGLNRTDKKNPDQFRYYYHPHSGDGTLSANIVSASLGSERSSAGIMFRNSSHATSPYVFLGRTSGDKVEGCLRDSLGRFKVIHNAKVPIGSLKIRMAREGGRISGYQAVTSGSWVKIFEVEGVLPDSMALMGIITTSGGKKTLSEATFRNVEMLPKSGLKSSGGMEFGGKLHSEDVGDPPIPGVMAKEGGEYFIQASGWEIGGSGDTFHFAFQNTEDPREITARVIGLDSANERTSGGIMIRDGMDAKAKYVFLGITPGWGALMSYRPENGKMGKLVAQDDQLEQMPRWLKLSVNRDWVEGFTSNDGIRWIRLGKVKIDLGRTAAMGLAATSYDAGRLISAKFDKLSLASSKQFP